MTLVPEEHRRVAQFNKRGVGEPAIDMAMLDQRACVKEVEGWKASLNSMSRCDMEVGSEKCHRVVDEILAIAESSDATDEVMDMAGSAIAGMFGEFQSNAVYNEILVRMLDRVYMVPGGCDRLDAFFGGIKIDSGLDDKYAYFALDVVRVVLRYLFVRGESLRGSRQAALGACYDAMRRVAVRNGLDSLARTMGNAVTRAEYCSPDSEICRMAMLRISTYDKRDVPSDVEVLEVLGRYPMLRDVLDPGRVIETKPLLTRLVHHISLNHLVAQEDHEWAYTAVYESNVRLGYWLGKIDLQRGGSEEGGVSRPGKVARELAFAGSSTMVDIRYMMLEIADFWSLYDRIRGLVKGMDISDPEGIYGAVCGHGSTRKAIEEMRDGFGARHGWTFVEAAKRIEAVGLETLVLYAHLVLMFQDAVYRTIPGRHRRRRLRDVRQLQAGVEFDLVAPYEAEETRKAYSGMSVAFNGKKTQRGYVAMCDSLSCMVLLYTDFVDAVKGHEKDTLEGYRGFSRGAYSAKYMILELYNFIEQYAKMGITLKRDKIEFTPNIIRHGQLYQKFRNGYAAHTRMDGIRGMREMTKQNPGLISDMLRDVVEAEALVARLSREFSEYRECSVMPMTGMQVGRMEERLAIIRKATKEYYDNGPVDPNQEKGVQRRRMEVESVLGI